MAYQSKAKAGCYGLLPPEEGAGYQEIELPLKRLKYDVELSDSLAFLQLEQVYANTSKKILTVQYIFPVNPQAAIHNFQVSFGGKNTKGIVKSKEEAQKQFQEHDEERRGVGFGGYYNSSARDIVKIKLGNIMPGQQIIIKMSYIHPVSVVLNNFYEFKLTTSITPRYVSKLEPRQIVFRPTFDRHMEGVCSWFLSIKIKSSRKINSLFSKTHKISHDIKQLSQDTYQVPILDTEMKPNKDFMLAYSFEDMEKPSVLISETDNCTQAMLSFVPKFFSLDKEKAQKMACQEKQYPLAMSKIKAEYVFLLDRSGSMGGDRIKKAIESLIIFLKSLPEDSYFNVISFGHYFDKLYEDSQKINKNIIKQAIEKIKVMDADHGGTQILQPLKDCLKWNVIPNYARHIFLLTDGAIQNTSEVLAYVATHIQNSRVHSIGIGNGASEDLILGCAKQGKGYSVMIADQEDPSSKIIQILEKSLSPLISKIQLDYDKNKVESVVPNPEKTPYLLKNEVANFYFTFKGKLTDKMTISVLYTDSMGQSYCEKTVIYPQHAPRCNFLSKMVDFVSLNALYSMYKYEQSQEDHFFYVKQIDKNELEKRIIKESIQKQILTELTAFLCVDEFVADQFLKAKLKEEKESINIHPMNPIDHKLQGLKVIFGNQDDDQDQYSQEYEDECALAGTYTEPVYEINNTLGKKGQKMKLNSLFSNKPPKMKVINLAKKGQDSIIGVKNHGLIKELLDMIELQEVNGMWSGLDVLSKIYNADDIKTIIQVFKSIVKEEVMITLAVIQQIKSLHDNSKKVSLIIRKARQYIEQNSNLSFEELQRRWSVWRPIPK